MAAYSSSFARTMEKVGLALAARCSSRRSDEKAINDLIDQLSDDDPDKREAANAQLTRYGPASWPILEKKMDDQAQEACIRIQQLLHNRIQPTLGGRTLVDGIARVADRFDDGGMLLYAAGGVSIPQQDKPPQVIKPAWVSIRPGLAIELVDPVLVKEADPDKQHLFAFDNEWIISDPTQGPRRLVRQSPRTHAGTKRRILLHQSHWLRSVRALVFSEKSTDGKAMASTTRPTTEASIDPATLKARSNLCRSIMSPEAAGLAHAGRRRHRRLDERRLARDQTRRRMGPGRIGLAAAG